MRRSAWITLFLFMTAAVAAAVAFVWVPRVEQRRDRAWTSAGQRAIGAMRLPVQFQAYTSLRIGPNSTIVCGGRCFAAEGDPRENVDAVRRAVAELATGPVSANCGPDGGFASSPDRCRVVAPVDGSRVEVFLFAKFVHRGHRPVDAGDFNGTLMYLGVAPRS